MSRTPGIPHQAAGQHDQHQTRWGSPVACWCTCRARIGVSDRTSEPTLDGTGRLPGVLVMLSGARGPRWMGTDASMSVESVLGVCRGGWLGPSVVLHLMMRCNTTVRCRVARCGVHRGLVGAGGVVVGLCLVGCGFAVVVVPGLVGFEGFPGVTGDGVRGESAGKTSDSVGVAGLGAWSGFMVRPGGPAAVRSGFAWWLVPFSGLVPGAGSLRLFVGTTVPSWPRQRRPHGPHHGDCPTGR